jgi:transcriptional regulator with XRE-family HTH domain
VAETISLPITFAREIRLRKGYTQAEMGSRLNCSAATISAIENGKAATRAYAAYLMTLATAPVARKRTPGGASRIGRRTLARKPGI